MAIIGTFGSYTAARLGIYASQASLNVTGNNIANVNTNGYTRQRMDLRSIYGGAVDRYVSKYSVNIGYGVLVDGENGKLVTPGSVEELAAALELYFKAPDKVRDMQKRAVETAGSLTEEKVAGMMLKDALQ